jgi:hypothetical protein
LIDANPSKSEWHRTFIQFIPLLAPAPLFNQTIDAIDSIEPMLREAIHKLCSEFHTAAPIDQEFSISREASSGPDRVELILDRASSALDRRRDNTKSKVDQLEELLDGFAALVTDLRAELREKVETSARIEKDLEQAQLIPGVRAAQQDADELTQKIAIDRGIHVDALTNRLTTLVDSDRESDDLNPMRHFDFFFL